MKKGWKIFWIVCAIIALVGVGLCVSGIALGFSIGEVERAFKDESSYIEKTIFTVDESDSADSEEFLEDSDITAKASELEGLQSYSGVDELSIDMGAGQVVVKTYDGDFVKCDFEGLKSATSYSVNQDGEELNIEVSAKKNRIFSSADVGKMVIYFPEDIVLKELSVEAGAGDVLIGDVIAENMDLDCGAGRIEYVSNRSENTYNYDIQCGVGEVLIGENRYSGLGAEKTVNNNSDYNMNIDCGVGEVVVRFNK